MAPLAPAQPPRVLLVMPEQWPRALLRAELRERGYDALGAPGVAAALAYPVSAPARGPVRLILIDQAALGARTSPCWRSCSSATDIQQACC
jgi:Response regulators consisting of a CheY-like receiver domain and a winged-helix DNA-binding domain